MALSRRPLQTQPLALRARWVLPVSGSPLRDAAVNIFQGRIVAVGAVLPGALVEDLGDVAIVPGFVNAHTHLEFSDIRQPIGFQGIGMVEWLRLVIERRGESPASGRSPVEMGLDESFRFGVGTIGEIGQPGLRQDDYRQSSCDGVAFIELIAPRADRVAAALEIARQHLSAGLVGQWQPGLSPHAPYTVHPELLERAVRLSVEYRVPLAMHLAESREELEFLRDGSGPFRELLEARGAWDATAWPRGSRPLDVLRVLARADRAVVVHGNYLDAEEIAFVADHRENVAIVYCPRTHAWFGHERYPLEAMLSAGATVALGTDSRASSPDLSLLAEMRHIAREFPAMNRATILELGTLHGARALGREDEIGSLEPGKLAQLAVVDLPDGSVADPHELILDGDHPVVETRSI